MEITILEVKSKKKIDAIIERAKSKDMPIKKNGWQFTWKTLYKTEGAQFYKLSLMDDSKGIQGILMLSIMYEEMLYMNNIEVAPHNLGSKGKYNHVAENLIAFACKKSFELGKNTYKGYLTFESKTKLIPLYQEKYGATLAMGQRMFIEPEVGLVLIDKYLKSQDMPKRKKEINPGGVNGTGKGVVNTNSKDFKGLRQAIQQHAKKQSPIDIIRYELISLKFQMESYIANEEPLVIINVGEFLNKYLKAIKIKNKDFAKYIEMEESNLSSIIRGRRKINIDLAFKLGQVFNVDPNLWLLIQSKNELLSVDEKRRLAYQKYRLDDLLKKVG